MGCTITAFDIAVSPYTVNFVKMVEYSRGGCDMIRTLPEEVIHGKGDTAEVDSSDDTGGEASWTIRRRYAN